VLCVTVGVTPEGAPNRIDWSRVEQLSHSAGVPVVVKGVMRSDDAERALDRGANGLVASNHGGSIGQRGVLPVDVLPGIADAVAGRAPVLVDGSFRRGSDILKGLALGATAVLLARPVMWGLAAYGAHGVEAALRLLITELARNMAASGRPKIDMIDRELVRLDSR
jgi:isopentenyl diphosphate isomerase/L-lactate dehydrogenase-like FMN-dependent dehydrogenase